MEAITITRPQLADAMLRWAQDARDGKCLAHSEADAMPLAERAKAGADRLWADLGGAPTPDSHADEVPAHHPV